MPQFVIDFFAQANNPFEVLVLILKNGGLIIFFPLLVWMCWHGWHIWIQEKYVHKKKRVLLAIDVPKLTEQNMKAVEQIITALHGVHFSPNKKETHWIGVVQDNFSLEIVSIDGYVQYFVRCDDYNAELVKGAIFAQYPDAEIVEVEDYVKNAPNHFPDPKYDMWGCEFILAKSGIYPIKTYEHFEHSLSGTFADPVAAILEALSRIYPGEQVWLQIVLTPEGHHWAEHAQHEVDALAGKAAHHSGHWWDFFFDVPMFVLGGIRDQLWPLEAGEEHAAGHEEAASNFMALTTGEKIVVEEAQKKLARLVFETKFRFIYLAPKEVMNAYRVVGPVIGVMKQFNASDLNSLVVGHTCTSGPTYYRVKQRLNKIKSHLMEAYKHRSNEEGDTPFIMSTAEIATLFHFPSETVRAPLVSKTETKKAEPPARLPLENSPFVTLRRTVVNKTAPAPHETSEGEISKSAAEAAAAGAPLHSMPGLPPGVVPVARAGMVSAPLRPAIRKTLEEQTFTAPPPPDMQHINPQTSISRRIPVQEREQGAPAIAQTMADALHTVVEQSRVQDVAQAIVKPVLEHTVPQQPQHTREYIVDDAQQQHMQDRIEAAKSGARTVPKQWRLRPKKKGVASAAAQQPSVQSFDKPTQTAPEEPAQKGNAPSNLPFG